MITYSIFLVIFLVCVFWREQQYRRKRAAELSFLDKYEMNLSKVRHDYYSCGSVMEAAPELSSERKPVNRFEKLFYAVAVPVLENGDSSGSEGSVFLAAVLRIRQEIAEERRFLMLAGHKYTGLALTAVWPLATVPFIAYWASNALESLLPFYIGRWGYLILFGIASVSAFCFEAIDRLRTPTYLTRQQGKLGKIAGSRFLTGCCALIMIVSLTVERHIEAILIDAQEGSCWPDCIIIPCCVFAAVCLFGLTDRIDEAKLRDIKKDEQKRFRYVIEMLRGIDGMGPVEMLESMEIFSEKYNSQISGCLNMYSVDSRKAIEELDKATAGELGDICEAFMASEDVGIAEAFDEITSQIEMLREENTNNRRIKLDRNVLIAEILAGTPGVLILFGYLVIPFMVKALAMFNTYQETLREFINIS